VVPPTPLPTRTTTRRVRLVALVMLFWLAQLQGLSHGISHLGQAGRDHAVPHAALCVDCIASANAGAAPLMALAAPVLASVAAAATLTIPRTRPAEALVRAYRSRAPPATST
jgi:hypothetical protein